MGDRNNTVKGAAILSAVLTVFCLLVFHFGLSLQLPLFQWEADTMHQSLIDLWYGFGIALQPSISCGACSGC